MLIMEKQKIPQNQQQKPHLNIQLSLCYFMGFWLRCCIKELSLPFSSLEECYTA